MNTSRKTSRPAIRESTNIPTTNGPRPTFTEDQFKDDFAVNNFVDSLTKSLVQAQDGGFKPAPFKALFDSSLDSLKDLMDRVDGEISDLVVECNAAESSFKRDLVDLSESFEVNFEKFAKLDTRINRVGSTAARIGDRLEAVDNQQRRATDAQQLIKYFMELNNANTARSDIFTDPNKVHELAVIIKKLNGVSQELDLASLKKGKMATEIISSNIENELLVSFEKAADERDLERMREFAHTLFDFNGGDSCVQRYILKLHMFFDVKSLAKDEDLAKDLSLRNVTPTMLTDTRLDEFYADILKTVQSEQEVINKVFPSPPTVLAQLIQRIFEQRVRTFLENMLQQDDDLLLYLRTLCLTFEKTQNILVQSLSHKLETEGMGAGVDFGILMNSVFCNYQDEYIDKEILGLAQFFSESINTIREQKQVSGELDGQIERSITINMANDFIQASEQAVSRCKILSHPADLPNNIQKVFSSIIKYLGYDYLDELVSKAMILPSPQDPRFGQTLRRLLETVATTTQVVVLVQGHFQSVIIPVVSASVNDYTQCCDTLGLLLTSLEHKISIAIDSALEMLVTSVDRLLAEQKKQDYKFKDDIEYDNNPTKTCQVVVGFIRNNYDAIVSCLDGRNVDNFLEEFGLSFQRSLMNHFKKFKVSKGLGGLKLLRDLTEYKDTMKLFQIEAVNGAFEMLGEIAKIHLVAPENLKTVIEEGPLSRMDHNDLMNYIRLRSDYKSVWIGKYV